MLVGFISSEALLLGLISDLYLHLFSPLAIFEP